ncbi:hypothetical protein BJY52DRAFT_1291425 [Lactarius psammicola]|nr:hypothetical protein BJY52DRAFT_1291425 [Lactarius psammicola]
MSSTNRGPPSFPQPFASAKIANPAQNSACTPEQPPIGPAQGPAYPSERMFARSALGTSLDTPNWSPQLFPVHRGTPSRMPSPNEPPRRLPAHTALYQPIQGSAHSHPIFPMPQVQNTRVPAIPLAPPPPMMQRNETTNVPSYLNITQVAPGTYSSHPLQAPIMSHSPSQRGSGVPRVAHTAPRVQRYQGDSEDEGHDVIQGIPAMHDGNMRSKSPPKPPVSSVPISVRYPPCLRCKRDCPEGQQFCSAECANPQWRRDSERQN